MRLRLKLRKDHIIMESAHKAAYPADKHLPHAEVWAAELLSDQHRNRKFRGNSSLIAPSASRGG